MDQCLQLRLGRTSIPLFDLEALFTSSVWPSAQPICIAVFPTGSVLDLVGELGQDFEPPGDLARRFCSLAQPNQKGVVRTQSEPSAV